VEKNLQQAIEQRVVGEVVRVEAQLDQDFRDPEIIRGRVGIRSNIVTGLHRYTSCSQRRPDELKRAYAAHLKAFNGDMGILQPNSIAPQASSLDARNKADFGVLYRFRALQGSVLDATTHVINHQNAGRPRRAARAERSSWGRRSNGRHHSPSVTWRLNRPAPRAKPGFKVTIP